MMKKIGLGILLVCFFTLFIFQSDASASEIMISSKKGGVPIYDNRGGVLSEMGKMSLGEPLISTGSYGTDWWQVKFGNAYGYIKKSDVTIQNSVKVPAKNKQPNTNRVVLIQKDAGVFDNSSGALKQFATVKAGYRYPIISDTGNWWKINVGGRDGFIHKSAISVDLGVPVLMYHHILTPQEKAISPFANASTTITTKEFNQQMDFLKANGFTTISTKDLEGYLNRKENLPAKAVVITIDDGNISSRIYAYPKLKEHGFIADQFIITGRTPQVPQSFNPMTLHFLSQKEMDEMADVYNYLAHTHVLHSLTKANESFFVTKSVAEVRSDLLLNRQLLKDTTYFAYPFGKYNQEKVKLLREVGFTMAFTTVTGKAQLGVDKLLIPREGVPPNLSMADFAKKVGGTLNPTPPKPTPPKPEKDPNALFTDVKKGDELYETVLNLTERGIIKGFPDGSFKPFQSVTRGQAAKILANVLNLDTKNVGNPQFIDVNPSNEYYGAIAALSKKGIINGYPDGTFKPGNQLTRAQMAKIITIGFELEQEPLTDRRFNDVKSEDEFASYVQALLTNAITKGTSSTTFSPYDTVKRGQLTSFVVRSETAQAQKQKQNENRVAETITILEAANWEIEFAEEATVEEKVVAVEEYVNGLLEKSDVKVRVEMNAEQDYVITLSKGKASQQIVKHIEVQRPIEQPIEQ